MSDTLIHFSFATRHGTDKDPECEEGGLACGRDLTTSRSYCCDPESVCFTYEVACAGDGSTFGCGNPSTWCCLTEKETCTKADTGQFNGCWGNVHNPTADIGTLVLNRTYSSLSAANPNQSSWSFDPATLIAATQTSSHTPSSTPHSSTPSSATSNTAAATSNTKDSSAADSTHTPTHSTPNAPTTPTSLSASSAGNPPSTAQSSSKSISGGAIGGIVVGVVALVVLVAIAVLFFRQQCRTQNYDVKNFPWMLMTPPTPVHELSTGRAMVELSTQRPIVELPAGVPSGYEEYRHR